jgi:hypothetical protein
LGAGSVDESCSDCSEFARLAVRIAKVLTYERAALC